MRILILLLLPVISFSQLLYNETADGSTLFNGLIRQSTTAYGITISTARYYTGLRSVRFELRDTDPMNNSGTRAEVAFPSTTNLNRWYSFALYFPADGYKYDAYDEVVSQWHQGASLSPALCLRTRNDRLYLRVMGTWVELCAIDKDKWHSYVMHVKHSSGTNGLVEIWRDGVLIKRRIGQNMYKVTGDVKYPNWKLGIYKSAWNDSKTTQTKLRVLYFDDIRMGNEKATLADMTPKRY